MSPLPTPHHLRHATRVLHRGGILAYPTEAVYGLGCDPLNPVAVSRLLALKQRDPAKGLILIAAEFGTLQPLLLPISRSLRQRLATTWPGPVTWLLPARPECPRWLTGDHDTLAVRVTAHPGCRALCHAWQGPLVSTSANITRHRPARHKLAVRKQFHGEIDFILPGELGNLARPTEIRTLEGELVRAG